MLKKAVAVFFVCASIAIWIGCGSTSSHYVYATIPAANQVQVYREDPNSGGLTTLSGSPFTAVLARHGAWVRPPKKALFLRKFGVRAVVVLITSAPGLPPAGGPRPP